MNEWRKRLITISCAIAMVGCVTYSPPKLDPERTARLVCDPKNQNLAVVGIDRKLVSLASAAGGLTKDRQPLIVAPGRHILMVEYPNPVSPPCAQLVCNAEPGKTYTITAEMDAKGQLHAWVEDAGAPPAGGQHLGDK